MDGQLRYGEVVVIPWGVDEVRGTVAEIYGTEPRVHLVVLLTPELTGYVIDEPTTVSFPIKDVRRAGVAA
jgi:hypothetical protein